MIVIYNRNSFIIQATWNTKGGSITVLLTSCLTGLDQSVFQIKIKIVSCHTADSKPVKQEVNGTVILPSLVFPVLTNVSQVRAQRCIKKSIVDIYRLTRQQKNDFFGPTSPSSSVIRIVHLIFSIDDHLNKNRFNEKISQVT